MNSHLMPPRAVRLLRAGRFWSGREAAEQLEAPRWRRVQAALRPLALCAAALLLGAAGLLRAEELPEYRLKAAFLYNFVMFTEWPAAVGASLNVCTAGADPFGAELDALNGKAVGTRTITVQRRPPGDPMRNCQVIFVPAVAIDTLPRIAAALRGQPTLIVTDSPGAIKQGAMLNMALTNRKVSFSASVPAARSAGLVLSSKLLRLATEVEQ